jgi:hypothetical protein
MLKVLRSQSFLILVLALALLGQVPHAAHVFLHFSIASGVWATLHSYAYALAVEMAILLFVVHARHMESYIFAGVSVLVNLAYYSMQVSLFTFAALPVWLVSFALPCGIALYSHLLADDLQEVETFDLRKLASKVRNYFSNASYTSKDDMQVASKTNNASTDMQLAGEASYASEVEVISPASLDASLDDLKVIAQELRSEGKSLAEIAQVVGKSESWVSRNSKAPELVKVVNG